MTVFLLQVLPTGMEFLSSSAGNSRENSNGKAGRGSGNVGSHLFGNPLEQTWLHMQLESDVINGGRRNIGNFGNGVWWESGCCLLGEDQ